MRGLITGALALMLAGCGVEAVCEVDEVTGFVYPDPVCNADPAEGRRWLIGCESDAAPTATAFCGADGVPRCPRTHGAAEATPFCYEVDAPTAVWDR